MLIAYMKLRRRTLGPLLDPAGWAINAQARLNIPFGTSVTQLAALPEGAERTLNDPFEEKKNPWLFYTIVVLLIAGIGYAWYTGKAQEWLADMKEPPPAASASASASAAPAPPATK
ncbi:MAG: hypothetical protein IPK82_38875 [Polyangiaceae bacterium]|nr:hypothetical protein [Polyangiaceae bacterium]